MPCVPTFENAQILKIHCTVAWHIEPAELYHKRAPLGAVVSTSDCELSELSESRHPPAAARVAER